MVWVLAAGLALVALGLGIKVALLRHGIKALRQDLVERRGQDTNTLLSLPCRDRELRRLASALTRSCGPCGRSGCGTSRGTRS